MRLQKELKRPQKRTVPPWREAKFRTLSRRIRDGLSEARYDCGETIRADEMRPLRRSSEDLVGLDDRVVVERAVREEMRCFQTSVKRLASSDVMIRTWGREDMVGGE